MRFSPNWPSRAIVVALALIIPASARAQVAAEFGHGGEIKELKVGGVVFLKDIGVSLIKPGWAGRLADQRSVDPALLRVEKRAVRTIDLGEPPGRRSSDPDAGGGQGVSQPGILPGESHVQFQDDRKWNVPGFSLLVMGEGGRLKAGKTVRLAITFEASSAETDGSRARSHSQAESRSQARGRPPLERSAPRRSTRTASRPSRRSS